MSIRERAWAKAFASIGLAAGAALASTAMAASKTPTVEDFVRKPSYDSVKLAPDGKHIAAAFLRADRHALAIIALSDRKVTGTLWFDRDEEVANYWWVGPDRVVGEIAQEWGAVGQMGSMEKLFGIDADGSHKLYLFGYRSSSTIAPATTMGREQGRANVLDPVLLAPNGVMVAVDPLDHRYDRAVQSLRILNPRSGALIPVAAVPLRDPVSVAFSPLGRPVLATGQDDNGDVRLMRLPEGSNSWVDAEKPGVKMESAWIQVARFDDPTQVSYFSDEGSDTTCLRVYDLTAAASSVVSCDPRVDVDEVDFSPVTRKPISVTYEDGYPRTVPLEPDSPDGRMIRMLTETFPKQRVRITSSTRDGNQSIVLVDSDRNPGDFYLFDRTTRKAEYVMSKREWIDPEQMRPMEPIRYQTRDGATIDGYLTRPAGDPKAKVPLVLMPHGGPHGVRDRWDWDPWTQWLALNGYAVLQVNYRGSGGYGFAHQSAGYRKWGTLMMEDLADGVKWAIESGVTEPARVCIFGASFGGYASMMSVVKEPDLYRCAATYAGVYDLASQGLKSDIGDRKTGRRYLDRVVSDDKDEMEKNSPITYVDRLKVPVMIAHGTDDQRVPFDQAKRLRAALEKAKKPFEWHEYGGEQHGLYKDENHIAFLQSLAAFFDKNIGKGASPSPPPISEPATDDAHHE